MIDWVERGCISTSIQDRVVGLRDILLTINIKSVFSCLPCFKLSKGTDYSHYIYATAKLVDSERIFSDIYLVPC